MDLTFDRPGDHHYIRSFNEQGIRIADEHHTGPLILSADSILPWPPASVGEIEDQHLEAVIALKPEIVLIGTGVRQVFLSPRQMMLFYEKGIGIEVMATDPACRTFNILVSEGRNVVAALIQ